AKRTSWNEFSTAMAFAVICLSKGQRFNFSKYIFDSMGMIANRQPAEEELGAEQVQVDAAVAAAVIEDVVEDDAKDVAHVRLHHLHLMAFHLPLKNYLYLLNNHMLHHQFQHKRLEIFKLKARLKKLEQTDKVKYSKLRRLRKVGASRQVESSDDMEDVFNQGRMMNKDKGIEFDMVEVVTTAKLIIEVVTVADSQGSAASATIPVVSATILAAVPTVVAAMIDDLDKDEGIELVKDADIAETEGRHAAEQAEKRVKIYNLDLDHSSKVLSMQEDDSEVQEVVKIVTTAKLITNVVTAASQPSIPSAAPTVVATYTRRRKGVIIKDPKEELSSKTPAETPKLKDKGKGILIETPKPMKKKDQIELDAEYAKKLHEEINKDHEEFNKDIDWDAAMDHNTAGYKMDFFKGMSYAEIYPIFQARFDENMRFLFKSREEMKEEDQEIIKSLNETPAHKAAKRRKLSEEAQEAEDLKKRLEVVDDEDDDVFIEAIPLARKVPVVDYQIVLVDNKPRFKIIKADETHLFYISFTTLPKNFDREDLENL
nr:hypothetical protein [Tanacetum cinerariifolium]